MMMTVTFQSFLMATAVLLLLPRNARGFVPVGINVRHLRNVQTSTSTTIATPKIQNGRFGTVLMMVPLSSREYILKGMEQFRQGDVVGSIESFDASVPPGVTKPYLWQRGISYYYVDEFTKASQQFRDDVLQSPLDVEEIVWDVACLTRIDNTNFPPSNKLSLPRGKQDRRPIMATVYSLFRGEATEHDLADFGHKGSPGDEFYSLFYLGLYNDARGDMTKAEHYMKSAIQSKYAIKVGSQDYMVDVAKVHCKVRGWTT